MHQYTLYEIYNYTSTNIFLSTGGVALRPFFRTNAMVTAMADILMQGLTPERQELVRPVITLYRQGLISEEYMIGTLQHIMENVANSPGAAPTTPTPPKYKAPPVLPQTGAPGAPLGAAGGGNSWAQVAASAGLAPTQMPVAPQPMQMPSLDSMFWDPQTNLWWAMPPGFQGKGKKGKKGDGKGKKGMVKKAVAKVKRYLLRASNLLNKPLRLFWNDTKSLCFLGVTTCPRISKKCGMCWANAMIVCAKI